MEPFIHLSPYPFVICTICQAGCIASETVRHLQDQHSMTVEEARRIQAMIAAIPDIISSQTELQAWESPPPTTPPIPHIAAPATDGLGCNACRYVVRYIKRMQTHCRQAHGWQNSRKQGRITKEEEAKQPAKPWRTGVHCQRFFHRRAASHWFEVGRAVPEINKASGSERETAAAFIMRVQQEQEETFKSETKALIQEGDNKWEFNRWLHRTGWARHLDGLDRDQLRATRVPIGEDEAVLAKMHSVLMAVMDKAYTAVARVDPGSDELFEMERVEAEGPAPKKPFISTMEPDSWAHYKEQWGTLLCIWQRIELWEEEARPPYRMTTKQQASWAAFSKAVEMVTSGVDTIGRYSPDRLEGLCLEVVMHMLDHAIQDGRVYSNVVISALAVMGIGPGGGWVPAESYTPLYSAVIKGARMMGLYQATLERERKIIKLEQTMGRQEAEETATGLFSIIRCKVRRFMTRVSSAADAQPTPMSWIINTRTYGMKIRYTTPGSEAIDWRGDQITHGKVRVSITQLADMMHRVVQEARQTLAALTMVEGVMQGKGEVALEDVLPRIPWSRVEDRHGESQLGHSFLQDEGNAWWVAAGHDWVAKQIAGSEAQQAAWIQTPFSEKYPYRGRAIREYGRLVDELREQLWVLMHLLGGQPARSQEILGLRMWNTANGGVRNIFVHQGMVCFVTMYHKGARRTDTTKVIHRYVPREVGGLLVWYMWLVLPFWQKVQGRVKGQRRVSAFLWADEVVGDKKAGIIRSHRKGSHKEEEEEKEQEAMKLINQEEEEAAAFMDWYRERKWTRDRVLRVLRRYGMQCTGQGFTISGWRQMAIGIANRYLQKAFGTGEGEGGEDEGEDGEGGLVDSIVDLQCGHGSHVAGLIYARLIGQGDLGTMRSRDAFHRVSMQWHRLFGMGAEDRLGRGPGGGTGAGKRTMEAFDWEREHLQRQRFGRLHRADMRGALRQMMGPSAVFRGMQEAVLRCVMQGSWPIVQVAATGSGKSLTFMLPAFCVPEGVTVVITPLVALENDMVQRCARLGIDGYIWKRDQVQRAASLVFVTPESVVTKGFQMFVERMHGQQKLDRVVVDECHTLLGYSKTFRPQMGRIGQALQGFGVPVVCLTATLRPSDEERLFMELGFPRARVHMFRERTTRRNIAYKVQVVEDGDEAGGTAIPAGRGGGRGGQGRGAGRAGRAGRVKKEEEAREDIQGRVLEEEVVRIVQDWVRENERGKVIVYGGTIDRVDWISKALGCVGYWSQAGSAERKQRMMASWVGSEAGWDRVIIATNALGLGVDVGDVRLVVHGGMPRDIPNFVQESGRGGRDGAGSGSVVVVGRGWLCGQCGEGGGKGKSTSEGGWEAEAIAFVEGKRCRREVLDSTMDRVVDRVGCEGGEAACDVCEGQRMQQDITEFAEATEGIDEGWEVEVKAEAETEAAYEASQRGLRRRGEEARARAMREASEVEGFAKMVARWAGCCVVCWIQGREEEEHGKEQCPDQGKRIWAEVEASVQSVSEEMFTKRRFAAYAGCFGCGMPQWLCQGWAAADEDGRSFSQTGKACQYGGVLMQMYVGLRMQWREEVEGILLEMLERSGIDMRSKVTIEQTYRWLGGLVEWGGMQASEICRFIYIVGERVKREERAEREEYIEG